MSDSSMPGPQKSNASGEPVDPEFKKLLDEFASAVNEDRIADQATISLKLLAHVANEAEANPSPDLLLKEEAHRCEEAADWAGAEAAYRKVLDLEETQQNEGFKMKALQDLAALHALLGQHALALVEAEASTAAARRADILPVLFMALEFQAQCALRVQDTETAWRLISEMMSRIPDEKLYALRRASGLIVSARCQSARSRISEAEADLAQAWEILSPRSDPSCQAGVHSSVARWWEATAEVRSRKGDFGGAVEAWERAVASREHVSSLAQAAGPRTRNALTEAYTRLAECLRQCGRPSEAAQAQAQSHRIRVEIGLPDPENHSS